MARARELIEQAVAIAGSQKKLGERAGVTQNAIWQALLRDRASAELSVGIHRATNGQVRCGQLRPDLFAIDYDPPALATDEVPA